MGMARGTSTTHEVCTAARRAGRLLILGLAFAMAFPAEATTVLQLIPASSNSRCNCCCPFGQIPGLSETTRAGSCAPTVSKDPTDCACLCFVTSPNHGCPCSFAPSTYPGSKPSSIGSREQTRSPSLPVYGQQWWLRSLPCLARFAPVCKLIVQVIPDTHKHPPRAPPVFCT
jgi:hypothetical protein